MNNKMPSAPYIGPLTPEEIVNGMKCAHANAVRLLNDAKLLREHNGIPSATSLAILAIEEHGKISILKYMALLNDQAKIKAEWRNYRSHRAKNVKWILPELVKNGARTMESLIEAVDKDAAHTQILDIIKQHGFYTDIRKRGIWAEPNLIIDADFCDAIISIADFLLKMKIPTQREVEAWREIVSPHHNKPTMANAVIEWQRTMFAEGLSDTPPETVEAFMRGEPYAFERES